MFSSLLRGAVLASLALGAGAALANPFAGPNPVTGSLTWNGFSNGSAAVNVNVTSPAKPYNGNAGEFGGTFNPSSGDAGSDAADDFFRFFCIDLYQTAQRTALIYTRTQGIVDADNSWQLAQLFDLAYPNKTAGNFLGGSNFGAFASATQSAAMQLAIWEIWYDNDLALATGNFQATGGDSATRTQAQTYLNGVAAAPHNNGNWTLYRFENQDAQDYLSATYTRTSRENKVPLPGTLALLGIGLAGLGVARRQGKH
jgi:hypothetical protein